MPMGRRGWGLRAFQAVAWGPQCFTDTHPGPPGPTMGKFSRRSPLPNRPGPGLFLLEAPTFPRTPGKWRGLGWVTGCVRLQKAPGVLGVGQSTVPTTEGPREGVPKSACITACHSRAPKRLPRLSGESGCWAGPPRPASPAHVAGTPPHVTAARWQRKAVLHSLSALPAASPSACLGFWKAKKGHLPAHGGLEAPPCLAPAGEPSLGKAPPHPGLLVRAAGGKPGLQGNPSGAKKTGAACITPTCHPCSGPHQRQTPGSWSMRRKTGKYSDQREGITVQKKPVQPERAPARLERPAPPPRWKSYRSSRWPDWGATAGA